MFNQQTRRILDYLLAAEEIEYNPWLKEDVRQAWIVLRFAARGVPNPFVISSYIMYGVHPEKLVAKIEARRRAKLGPLYELIMQVASPTLPQKKPVQSEQVVTPKAA